MTNNKLQLSLGPLRDSLITSLYTALDRSFKDAHVWSLQESLYGPLWESLHEPLGWSLRNSLNESLKERFQL